MLLIVKKDVEEVEAQEDYLEELRRQTISSPNMDGMPHGSAQGDAMARLMIRKQKAEERMQYARENLERSRREAARILSRFDTRQRRFYEAYYMEGDTLEAAAMFAGVSLRTGTRYIGAATSKENAESIQEEDSNGACD